jgi:GrpB-like predicted nucleotidyltransferase (UPF0157 family)
MSQAGDPGPLPPPVALNGPVTLVDYDPAWPTRYEALAARIRHALGGRVVALHHAGSTSVPGLAAKPIIDMLLEVADSADEPGYVSALGVAGFSLRIREPGWFEHRLFRGAPPSNLHVFSTGCEEVRRMLAFRDHLRRDSADRALYEATKRTLAARHWAKTQDYADAKTAVVAEIMSRALA